MSASAREQPTTRDRILDAALILLNEQGPAGATTADIAAACGIREGNLHYHFNKKEHIVAALYDRFEAEVARTAAQGLADPDDPESYRSYQSGYFALMWRFRCFYRDGWSLFRLAHGLDERFARLQADARARARAVTAQAVRHGVLAATPAQIDRLLHNVWIVSCYWMSYRRSSGQADPASPDELLWGFAQILFLYEPYVTKKGASLARPPTRAKLRDILA